MEVRLNKKVLFVLLTVFAWTPFSVLFANEPVKVIGLNTSSLSLYESADSKKKSKKIPSADFSALEMEIKQVSENGQRFKIEIQGEDWWVKRTQVKTDKKYHVGSCITASDEVYAGTRGAGECNSD